MWNLQSYPTTVWMKECDILGVKTYSDPSCIFQESRSLQLPQDLRCHNQVLMILSSRLLTWDLFPICIFHMKSMCILGVFVVINFEGCSHEWVSIRPKCTSRSCRCERKHRLHLKVGESCYLFAAVIDVRLHSVLWRKGHHPTCDKLSNDMYVGLLLFNAPFSTNRLYRAIGVWNILCRTRQIQTY